MFIFYQRILLEILSSMAMLIFGLEANEYCQEWKGKKKEELRARIILIKKIEYQFAIINAYLNQNE